MEIKDLGDRIVLKLNILESLLSFKPSRKIEIPKPCIKRVSHEGPRAGLILRFPGTWIPGLLRAGTQYRREEGKWSKEFWFTTPFGEYLKIELEGHPYRRIVIKTSKARKLAREIHGAVG